MKFIKQFTALALLSALLLTGGFFGSEAPATVYAASEQTDVSEAAVQGPEEVTYESVTIETHLSTVSYDKALLKTIRDAILSDTMNSIYIREYNIPTSQINDLLSAVSEAYPLEYAVAGVHGYGMSSINGIIFNLSLVSDIRGDDSSASDRYSRLQSTVNPVVASLKDKSNYEKIITVHDMLVLNSQYDLTYQKRTAYDMLTQHTGVCQGYADAFKLYMDLLHIPCVVISSNAMNHAWNMVNLDGSWYHVDVTWDDPIPDAAGVTRYTHTLLNDAEITDNDHYGWSSDYTSASTAYSAMPRGTNNSQYWQNNRWYYTNNNDDWLRSCDRYGKNIKKLADNVDGATAAYENVILFGSGSQIKTYWSDTGLIGQLCSLTDAESDDMRIISMSVSGSKLSYTCLVLLWQSSKKEQAVIDLAGFFNPIQNLRSQIDALPDTVSKTSQVSAARTMLALYDSLNDARLTNLSAKHIAKAASIRTSLDAFSNAATLTITAQPTDVSDKLGASVSFKVTAEGNDLTYQWQLSDDAGKTWRNSSVKTAAYTTTLSTANNGRAVRCVVSDGYGYSVESQAAYMRIVEPYITEQPVSVTLKKGATASFKVAAKGDGLTYQWQLSDDAGKTWRNSSVKTANYAATVTDANNGRYVRCIVTDKFGNSVTSDAAYMKITTLKITTQPTNANVLKGVTASFKVVATGDGLKYQWQLSDNQGKTWRNSKATTANYAAAVTDANNGRYVRCIVTDKYGNSVTSNAAIMKIATLKITTQPSSVVLQSGATASFKVAATGSSVTYQWQLSDDAGKTWRNSKATSANYAATLSSANNGRYVRCIVTDKFGNKVTSNAASMKIAATTLKITKQPANANVSKGATASFKVVATGDGLKYQWQLSDDAGKTWRNSKATSANYAATVTDANNGRYVRCILTDKYGNKVTSNAAYMKIK